jgi:hypothetical protein
MSCPATFPVSTKLERADPSAVKHAIESQLDALVARMSISSGPPHRLLQALVGPALNGPFHDGIRRFSAINRDGVPFQWSVSVGSRTGSLRFVADCGLPGTRISKRVNYCRETLRDVAIWLPLSADAMCGLDTALECLLPRADLLDSSLMGLCVAAELPRQGMSHLRVYVNGEVGDVRERYKRFEDCLTAFNRRAALQQLRDLARIVGDRLVPAFVAVDLVSTGIGRLKLYFRPTDGTPALQRLAAEAAGCTNAATVLDALHRAFLIGSTYPAHAVDVSVEFPADHQEPGFKVDLRTISFLGSDAEVDLRFRRLLEILGVPDVDYCVARDVVVGLPMSDAVAQILFVGLASRRREYQADIYFHPSPRKVPVR